MSAANPSLGVNRVISDVLITARAHEAAAALPPGSARVTVLEFGESALKLLGLLLGRADRGDEDADTLDRCVAEGHLSVGLLREILEGAHHVLGDRDRIERLVGNQNLVSGVGTDERFEVGQSGDQDIVGDPPTASHACCGLDGDRQVRRYNEVPFRDISTHNKSPYVARALTRYVAGAHLTARRWLQRKAVTRRAAPNTRPSGTIPNDGTITGFVCDDQRTVALARDGAGGIHLDAHGVDGLAHLERDELWEFTDLLADLLDCDLRSRPND